MDVKLRKDTDGNIINKSNKNYHITINDNFVTIIEVESYKQYNIIEDDYDDEDENNSTPFIDNYNPGKVDNIRNNDPQGFSRLKCIII